MSIGNGVSVMRDMLYKGKRKVEISQTYSKLVIRHFRQENVTVSHIVTFIADKRFSGRDKDITKLRYNDWKKFSGFVLYTTTDGRFANGYRMINGKITHRLYLRELTKTKNTTRSTADVRMVYNYVDNSEMTPAFMSDFEKYYCGTCDAWYDWDEVCDHEKEIVGDEYCQDCGRPMDDCICGLFDICDDCGRYQDQCVCTYCPICGQKEIYCSCPKPCSKCGEYGCDGSCDYHCDKCGSPDCYGSCDYYCPRCGSAYCNGTCNINIGEDDGDNYEKYKAQEGDLIVKKNLPKTMLKQLPNTCVTSIMEYIDNKVFGGNTNQGIYDLHHIQKYSGSLYEKGIQLSHIERFMSDFFTTQKFTSYSEAINKGYTVMTDISTSQEGVVHNVLVVGYQQDGNLVYMDPERGYWCTAKETAFKQDYKIVITGKK